MGLERQTEYDRKGRAAERRHVQIGVKIRRPGETWFTSRITDVSVTGFRLQSFMKLTVGSDLMGVLFTGGPKAGKFEFQIDDVTLE